MKFIGFYNNFILNYDKCAPFIQYEILHDLIKNGKKNKSETVMGFNYILYSDLDDIENYTKYLNKLNNYELGMYKSFNYIAYKRIINLLKQHYFIENGNNYDKLIENYEISNYSSYYKRKIIKKIFKFYNSFKL